MYKVNDKGLNPDIRTHLVTYTWQFRTECGRFVPVGNGFTRWDRNPDGICAVCLRRATK